MFIVSADVHDTIVWFWNAIMIVGWIGDDKVKFLFKFMGEKVIMIGGSVKIINWSIFLGEGDVVCLGIYAVKIYLEVSSDQ